MVHPTINQLLKSSILELDIDEEIEVNLHVSECDDCLEKVRTFDFIRQGYG